MVGRAAVRQVPARPGRGTRGTLVRAGSPTSIPEEVPAQLWMSPGFLLSKAADQVESRFAEALRPHHITPREYGVLSAIAQQGPQSQQQLGERLGIDRTTMVNIVDSLEDGDLVRRVRDKVDRRRYAVTLSAKGERLMGQALPAVDAQAHAVYLAVLAPAEREQLLDMLHRVIVANS